MRSFDCVLAFALGETLIFTHEDVVPGTSVEQVLAELKASVPLGAELRFLQVEELETAES